MNIFYFGGKVFAEQVSFLEKIGLGFRRLDDVEVKFPCLRFGQDFGQQPFADGAKHADLQERVFGFKGGVEFLRLIDGH